MIVTFVFGRNLSLEFAKAGDYARVSNLHHNDRTQEKSPRESVGSDNRQLEDEASSLDDEALSLDDEGSSDDSADPLEISPRRIIFTPTKSSYGLSPLLAYMYFAIILGVSIAFLYTLKHTLLGPVSLMQFFVVASFTVLGGLGALYYFAYSFYQDVFYLFLSLGWFANAIYLLFEFFFPETRFDFSYSLKVYLLSIASLLLFYFAGFATRKKPIRYRRLVLETSLWTIWFVVTFTFGYWLITTKWQNATAENKFVILTFGGVPFAASVLLRVGLSIKAKIYHPDSTRWAYILPLTFFVYACLQPLYLLKLVPAFVFLIDATFFIALFIKILNGLSVLDIVTSDSLTQAEALQLREQSRQLREQSRRQSALKDLGVLTASIQHDLKNPLGVIKTEVDLMRKKFQGHSDILVALTRIEDQRQRMSAITRIIPVLRGGREYYEQYMEKTSVRDLMRRSVKAVQKEMNTSAINFKTDDRVFFVKAYRLVLQQAIVNVLKNAVEAIHEAGRKQGLIKIEFSKYQESKNSISITILDNGVGIPEENIPKLTGLFTTRKDKKANSGIGLFITERIMRIHHGRLEIKSQSGEGSTVSLILPEWNDE